MRKTFRNPPIVEALFEVFVPPTSLWTSSVSEEIASPFSQQYSGKKESIQIHGLNINLTPQGARHAETQPIPRTRLWDSSGGKMIQFGPEMCALNVLPPYSKFEDYLKPLEELVGTYLGITRPSLVNWIGQRYINRVELSSIGESPADVFEIYPKLPIEIRNTNAPFALQVQVMELPRATITANLLFQGIQPNGRPSYLLDIYAKSKGSMKVDKNDILIWHREVHEHLYRAFTFCINEQSALRLFGG